MIISKKIAYLIAFVIGSILSFTTQLASSTPWTPLEWQEKGKLIGWIRDANRNFIDDLIDDMMTTSPPDRKIGIKVAFNSCVADSGSSEAIAYIKGIGTVVYVGKIVTFAIVDDVALSSISALSVRPEVAMVELYTPVVPNLDYSTRAIKMYSGSHGASPFTYSPETVEDVRPDLVGNDINIAIIDSGVDNEHESLADSYIGGADCTDSGSPGVCVSADPDDESGHGTHVAGIALGRGAADGTKKGVASGANLIDVKVFKGQNNINPIGATEKAMEWVILNRDTDWGPDRRRGIQVVNISLSGCDSSDGLSVLDQLVNAMVARGLVVATSAGNRNSSCGDSDTGFINRIPSIAAASLGITTANSVVGSLSIDDGGFSFRPTVDRSDDEIFFDSLRGPRSDGANKPDVAAPGTAIEAPEHDTTASYEMKIGTSMSAPHVAGLAGIILQENGDINPGSLKDLLIRTAHGPADPLPDVNNPVWGGDWGYGLIDAHQALLQSTGQGEERTDLTFEGFGGETHPPDPIWESPAIHFNHGTDNEDVLLLGSANDISIRVINKNQDADNVHIVLGIYYFSASDPDRPQFYEIASLTRDLPLGLTDIHHSWTPSRDFDIFAEPDAHICIRVSLNYGLDSDYSNYSNVAQRNLKRVAISSPAIFKFRVENPFDRRATIHLDVRPDDKNPPGWKANLSDNDFIMDPVACAKNIELTVEPAANPQPGIQATYRVYAFATTDEDEKKSIGGLTAQAYVPYKLVKPAFPYDIALLVVAAVLCMIALGGYIIVKKSKRK